MSMERDEIHRIVDELPEGELKAARRYLEFIRNVGADPVRRALENAPLDDEPETEEELRGVEQARRELEAGEVLTTEALKRELGL